VENHHTSRKLQEHQSNHHSNKSSSNNLNKELPNQLNKDELSTKGEQTHTRKKLNQKT